jgi:protein-disulfide isomerase
MQSLKTLLLMIPLVAMTFSPLMAEEKTKETVPAAAAQKAPAKKEGQPAPIPATPGQTAQPATPPPTPAPEPELTPEQKAMVAKIDKLKPKDLLKQLDDETIIGSPKAPVTIIEYASLSCIHCAKFNNEILPGLEKKYLSTGKAKLYFRDFPLNEPAFRAAMMVRCADKPKREAFIKTLFKTQEKWAFDKDFMGKLLNIAKIGGMKEEEFKACLGNKELEDKILYNRLAASKVLEVGGTPAIFVNGETLKGFSVEAIGKQIEDATPKAAKKP